MARVAAVAGTLAVAAVALAVGLWAGPETLPKFDETSTQYLGRICHRGAELAQGLYMQALVAWPGGVQVSVKRRDDGSSAGGSVEAEVRSQDKLKQDLARDEREINAQQEVSVKRYVEATKSAGAAAAADGPLMLPEQPDEVRERMPAVDPTGPEMRCGQEITPESTVVTRNVEIHVKASFRGNRGNEYSWSYFVTLRNKGKETVQMLTRHWVFVDEQGRLESEVKGPGARGVTPVLPPGAEWTYESGTNMPSAYGSMHGSFQFEVLQGDVNPSERSFSGRVGRLLLSSSGGSREIPCVSAASSKLLPLTSVLSVERVILGGRAEFASKKKAGSKDGKQQFLYSFHYDVQFNNARDTLVQVVSHSWVVVDSEGQRNVVSEGYGVGGSRGKKQMDLAAGDAFRVQGQLLSSTPQANAQGTYSVIVKAPDGTLKEIEARTDYMGLSANPRITHVPNFVVELGFI